MTPEIPVKTTINSGLLTPLILVRIQVPQPTIPKILPRNPPSKGVNGVRVSRAAFRVNGCRASGQIFGRGSGREAEKRPLLFPVVRQAPT